MEFISLLTGEEDRFGSRQVRLWQAGVLDGADKTRVHVARYEIGSLLGRHSISSGEAVLWHPGEAHESGSDSGMSALILASSMDPRQKSK